MLCKQVSSFECLDGILWCNHPNETSWAVLSPITICFSKFNENKFEIFFYEVCTLSLLRGKEMLPPLTPRFLFLFLFVCLFFFSGPPQQNVKTVSGGVGTIKRKREIRELLEQQDMNYEDDIFDATPFKKKKDIKVCWTAIQIKSPQLFFISFSLSAFYSSTSTNKPFYRHDVSTLALEWTWGWCWPCFDKNLFTFLRKIMLKILVRMRTTWLTL